MQTALLLDVRTEIGSRALCEFECLRFHRLRKDRNEDRDLFISRRDISMRDGDECFDVGLAREKIARHLRDYLSNLCVSS